MWHRIQCDYLMHISQPSQSHLSKYLVYPSALVSMALGGSGFRFEKCCDNPTMHPNNGACCLLLLTVPPPPPLPPPQGQGAGGGALLCCYLLQIETVAPGRTGVPMRLKSLRKLQIPKNVPPRFRNSKPSLTVGKILWLNSLPVGYLVPGM